MSDIDADIASIQVSGETISKSDLEKLHTDELINILGTINTIANKLYQLYILWNSTQSIKSPITTDNSPENIVIWETLKVAEYLKQQLIFRMLRNISNDAMDILRDRWVVDEDTN